MNAAYVLVPLTKGLFAKVSPEDADRVLQFKWTATVTAYGCRAVRRRHKSEGDGPARVYLHRFILSAPQDLEVDHIDHDQLNNCRDNLRLASPLQNIANRRPWIDGKPKGAFAEGGRWAARIRIDGWLTTIGRFDSKEEAGAAYDAVAIRRYGDFAFASRAAA